MQSNGIPPTAVDPPATEGKSCFEINLKIVQFRLQNSKNQCDQIASFPHHTTEQLTERSLLFATCFFWPFLRKLVNFFATWHRCLKQ